MRVSSQALWVKRVRASFILMIRASASYGCFQSSLDPFFGRLRSVLARSWRVGVSILRPVVTPHDPAPRRVRLQCRRVHPNCLASQQFALPQPFQHPAEHGPVRLQAQPLAQRGVLRRRLRQTVAQKLPQRDRVPALPRDAPAPSRSPPGIPPSASGSTREVHARRQARPARSLQPVAPYLATSIRNASSPSA